MKTIITSILTIGLLAGSAVGVAAQDEEAFPAWLQGRVEMPQHGYAITFPEGWVAERPDQTEIWAELAEEMRSMGVVYSLVSYNVEGVFCQFIVRPSPYDYDDDSNDWTVLIDDGTASVESRFGDALLEAPHFLVLDLPAGPALNGQYTVGDDGEAVRYSQFQLGREGVEWFIECAHTRRPADGWLSITETFEFLPFEQE